MNQPSSRLWVLLLPLSLASCNLFQPPIKKPIEVPGATRIHAIQGATPAGNADSPLKDNVVTVGAVVTAIFTGDKQLGGFFVQEETLHQDNNPATSEGIFVYCSDTCNTLPELKVGQVVSVKGKVTEFGGLTELTDLTEVKVLQAQTDLPAPVTLTLPLASQDKLEQYEGMRIKTSGVVTDNFLLGRGGSVRIADQRIFQFTQTNAPSAAGYAEFLKDFARRTLTIDDGSLSQNPDPVVFARDGKPLSASNTLRGGDSAEVTGVLSYSFEGWNNSSVRYRVHATDAKFTGPVRPAAPEAGAGSLKVAAMNVLNYFNGNGAGGGFPTSRGAESTAEFEKQQTKIIKALVGLDADVIGLLEIENDYNTAIPAIQTLVTALNSDPGVKGTYAYVNPVSKVGTDEIAVGIIYRKNKVTPVGTFAVLDNRFDPAYQDNRNRPTWAKTFKDNATGGVFTAVVAHLKSKGSGCGAGDDDTTTGQGNCNKTRTQAASILMDWLKTNPTGVNDADVLIMGDLNAYLKEDPIQAILKGADDTAGTADDFVSVFDANSYSYQFDGQWGSLDHALVSKPLDAQLKGRTKWHINSDEPTVLDYNENFKSAGQKTGFYAPDPFRSSDHDPLLFGLDLTADAAVPASLELLVSSGSVSIESGQSSSVSVGALGSSFTGDVTLTAEVQPASGITVEFAGGTTLPAEGSKTVTINVPAGTPNGAYTVTITGKGTGVEDSVTFTVNVTGGVVVVPKAWINEIHYDNAGTDVDEFVEVIVPVSHTPADLKVVLYNGNGGKAYAAAAPIFVKDSGTYKIYTLTNPAGGIQNGPPDGVAICDGTTLIQFLSYEGPMTATDGCASGETSMDIGVAEAGTETAGQSLQLRGAGNKYSDFTWMAPQAHTRGEVNTGQTLTP
ncbi:ExeM/NucH family extracellular endonuclease [Deinococcus cellulosilyticus]|uniref:Endonuclease/exonuclease/phosphatase domain-containing protein n=1 Tax=Deinococcus cellulosilyticus (strain DSM 18568 / NBRC 106333 / KACC 11606 / 5516J-15) TaxID=1223518 RepID=A0A511N330_DEIC1|nr:ExeM/NucH family extracellular endonuclease [Deinococcus cellulosilyticus]GEM46907.1 hypothetical protein DC3_25420 [Deinococcus cellulosilyticus NBRC 106333 = KACC 11606]